MDEAIASYKKAIELDPKNTSAISGLRRAERQAAARDKFLATRTAASRPKPTRNVWAWPRSA